MAIAHLPGELPQPPWATSQGDAQVLPFPPARDAGRDNALPDSWPSTTPANADLARCKADLEQLARGLRCHDLRYVFADLVGSSELTDHPVHRWYTYKEAYSPRLPLEVVSRLGTGKSGVVADSFAGVATTALSLQHHAAVRRVVGVEYSPFATFVGKTKLAWPRVSPKRLRQHIARLRDYELRTDIEPPELAAFSNDDIFKPVILQHLLSAREAVFADEHLNPDERAVLTLGLASIIEDVSGVMKDGRALRILRDRTRRRKGLTPRRGAVEGGGVRETLVNQWLAMAEDLEALAPLRARARKRTDSHLRGDARDLEHIDRRGYRTHPLADGSAGLFLYSPPYLNCIDYSEIYKLELWFLKFVQDQREFRDVRLGTLRSHPSVKFPDRGYLNGVNAPVATAVAHIADALDNNLPRSGLGTMAKNYFEDMYEVFKEQLRVLEPGGYFACVVANSTFSRRSQGESGLEEEWRLPLLTDVLLARLAETVGFEDLQIWESRDLRARNVRQGSARESVVVGRKPE